MRHIKIWLLLMFLFLLAGCGPTSAAEQASDPTEHTLPTAIGSAPASISTEPRAAEEPELPDRNTPESQPETEPEETPAERETAEPIETEPIETEPNETEPDETEQIPPDTIPEEPETTEPVPADAGLTGTVMEVQARVTATPDEPDVYLAVRFPQVDETGAEEGRMCTLELRQAGTVVDRIDPFCLTEGQAAVFHLSFAFSRYMDTAPIAYTVVLQYEGEYRVAPVVVELENYPDEVYAALSGDPKPYMIEVVRNHNVVIVYGKDDAGDYTVPVQVYVCSTGRGTPSGTYSIGDKYEWGWLFGGVAGQYVSRITGNILFHSVPYYTKDKGRLETEEYNKLGTAASMGCVRLPVRDAKWIYENCPQGTKVRIYDTETLRVEKPTPIHIDPEDPRAGWDPTDPDENNPWNN